MKYPVCCRRNSVLSAGCEFDTVSANSLIECFNSNFIWIVITNDGGFFVGLFTIETLQCCELSHKKVLLASPCKKPAQCCQYDGRQICSNTITCHDLEQAFRISLFELCPPKSIVCGLNTPQKIIRPMKECIYFSVMSFPASLSTLLATLLVSMWTVCSISLEKITLKLPK